MVRGERQTFKCYSSGLYFRIFKCSNLEIQSFKFRGSNTYNSGFTSSPFFYANSLGFGYVKIIRYFDLFICHGTHIIFC